MAIKVSTTTVITNARALENIANTDVTTRATINTAITQQNETLVVYDSSGTAVRTLYGAKSGSVV